MKSCLIKCVFALLILNLLFAGYYFLLRKEKGNISDSSVQSESINEEKTNKEENVYQIKNDEDETDPYHDFEILSDDKENDDQYENSSEQSAQNVTENYTVINNEGEGDPDEFALPED